VPGCHSPNGAGIPAQYPRLAGQHAEYTEAQLVAFPVAGAQMTAIAAKMNDAEIKAWPTTWPACADRATREIKAWCKTRLEPDTTGTDTRRTAASSTPVPSEITAAQRLRRPREWLRRGRRAAVGGTLAGWASRDALAQAGKGPRCRRAQHRAGALTMDKPRRYADATSYNNFYEFGTDKADPARAAGTLKTRPWTVAVEGEVRSPQTFDLETLLKLAPMEERIYRLRCVEGWSMVIPWVGYSLAELIKRSSPPATPSSCSS
jgi:hypothetical protein